jgi:hypothetical protein
MAIDFEVLDAKLEDPAPDYKSLEDCKKLVVNSLCKGINAADASSYYHITYAITYHLVSVDDPNKILFDCSTIYPTQTFTCTSYPTCKVQDFVIHVTRGPLPAGWDHAKRPCCALPSGCGAFNVVIVATPADNFVKNCSGQWNNVKASSCIRRCSPKPCVWPAPPTTTIPSAPSIPTTGVPTGGDSCLKICHCYNFECKGVGIKKPDAGSEYAKLGSCQLFTIRSQCAVSSEAAAKCSAVFSVTYHLCNAKNPSEVVADIQKVIPPKVVTCGTYPATAVPDVVVGITTQPIPAGWNQDKYPLCYVRPEAASTLLCIRAMAGSSTDVPNTPVTTSAPMDPPQLQ